MRYKLLGKSGLRVSELCLGTMTFGEEWGWGAPKEECQKVFDYFTEAGGNFLDTSVNYMDGTSEKFLGEFIKAVREPWLKPKTISPAWAGSCQKNSYKGLRRQPPFPSISHWGGSLVPGNMYMEPLLTRSTTTINKQFQVNI